MVNGICQLKSLFCLFPTPVTFISHLSFHGFQTSLRLCLINLQDILLSTNAFLMEMFVDSHDRTAPKAHILETTSWCIMCKYSLFSVKVNEIISFLRNTMFTVLV